MSDYVSILSMQQLLHELENITDWFPFGVRLGVPVPQLRKIEASHHGELERCKIEMLQYWLKNSQNTSWEDVVQALEQSNEHLLASRLRRQYLPAIDSAGDKIEHVGQSVPHFPAGGVQSVNGEQDTTMPAVTNPCTPPPERVVPFQFTFYKYESRSKFVSQIKNSQKPYLVIDECLKSHPFYTHKHGYKMCIGVAPQGVYEGKGTHLSLYAYLMKGEYDNNLKWPFRGTVHLQLINQLDPNEGHYNQGEPIEFNNSIPSVCCARVTMGDYSPHGWANSRFISNKKLRVHDHNKNTKYLKDDTIIIRVNSVSIANKTTLAPYQPQPLAITSTNTPLEERIAPYEFTVDYTEVYETGEPWTSNAFYSHNKGYLMCVEVVPPGKYGDTNLTVNICLMRGNYDDNLTWPFQGKVTIQLLNQEAPERHRELLIYFTDLVPAKFCERVTDGEMSPHGWGTEAFISKSALERDEEYSEKFLKDGIIKFRVINVTLIQTK